MATRAPKSSITENGKVIYLTNKELMAGFLESKAQGQMSKQFAQMLMLLCERLSKKGNFVGYSFIEDMRAYAMVMLVKTWQTFDPTKSDNLFAYYTQCVKNSYIQFLNQEQKQRSIRDSMMVSLGLNPSYGYDDASPDRKFSDEQDFDTIQREFAAQPQYNPTLTNMPIERDDKGNELPSQIIIQPPNEYPATD